MSALTSPASDAITHRPAASALALLGAFERDNFGDVLFLQLTQEFLSAETADVVAPFGAVGGFAPLGRRVMALRDVGAARPVDVVWMVGGEAGGTTMADAFRMSADAAAFESHCSTPEAEQQANLRRLTGRSPHSSPYLPRMSAADNTMTATFVINSAGLSGAARLVGHRRDETWTAIDEAAFVSVRDQPSAEALRRRGVTHRLAPDLVHTLRTTRPEWLTKRTDIAPYALVQVKESVLRAYGTVAFAALLLGAGALADLDIRLFVAGGARGHDSVALYQEVVRAAAELDPARPVTIEETGTAIEKAELIARAAVWAGTSLHGFIISSSFEVPRVGLVLDKLTRYGRTWDEPMPLGVPLDALDAAVREARSMPETPERAEKLALAAGASIGAAQAAVAEPAAPTLAATRATNRRVLARRNASHLRSLATWGVERLRGWSRA